MNVGGADMGKDEQLDISVEMPSSKVHGSGFRSMARQSRLVCATLFVVLVPFAITWSYLFYSSSDAPSDMTSLFEEQPTPAALPDKPHQVCPF